MEKLRNKEKKEMKYLRNDNMITISSFIKSMEPGLMIYEILQNAITNEKEFHFIIREDNYHINNISKNPLFELLVGVINIEDIALVVAMVRFNDNPDTIYETYLNIFSENGRVALNSLATQDYINFSLFGDKGEIKRIIQTDNNIKQRMNNIKAMTQEYLPWSMNDFDKAKEKFMKIYNNGFELFNYLKKVS